jgi:BirA family biotin operon repressor/biotin-[acetyl-CoA-carboxylase] ligase
MTDLSFALLRLLADGDFRSGPALARTLGVSRATVWNAVRAIEIAGLEVYKVRGRGYRLAQPVSLLDAAAIVQCVGAHARRLTVEIVDVADSTNTLLMQRAAAGAQSGAVIAAEWQSSGRGRLGRPWHSGVGRALTFSLLWRFTQGAGAIAGLSLAAGVAVLRALHDLGANEARLKWPNDVLWRGHKLAGMLIEMQGDALGPSAVVIGIGLNVRLSAAMRGRIDQAAADLESACGRELDRNAVLASILARLVQVLDEFTEHGFAPLRAEWERHHAHQGQNVAVKLPTGRMEEGVATGVADDGALLFQTGTAVRRLHSGEITVRAAASKPVSPAATTSRTRSGA